VGVALAFPAWTENSGQSINAGSGGKGYSSYLSAAFASGKKPGIVLAHSFNGLEQG